MQQRSGLGRRKGVWMETRVVWKVVQPPEGTVKRMRVAAKEVEL